jgi:hypothetical protein
MFCVAPHEGRSLEKKMKTNLFIMKFSFVLVFGILITAYATAGGGAQAYTHPASLVDITYSMEGGSNEIHFIDSEKVDMYFQGETLNRTYSYNASSGTGKIISGGTVSAGIYDFTIKQLNTDDNGAITEELVLTANVNAARDVMAVDPKSFHTIELEQFGSGDFHLQRKISAEEAQQAVRQAAEIRARETQERERQEQQRKDEEEQRVLAAQIESMKSATNQLLALKKFSDQQFQQFSGVYQKYQELLASTPRMARYETEMRQYFSPLIEKLSKKQKKEFDSRFTR